VGDLIGGGIGVIQGPADAGGRSGGGDGTTAGVVEGMLCDVDAVSPAERSQSMQSSSGSPSSPEIRLRREGTSSEIARARHSSTAGNNNF
jgi:hypothetical protein